MKRGDRDWLVKFIEHRVGDKRMMRWHHVSKTHPFFAPREKRPLFGIAVFESAARRQFAIHVNLSTVQKRVLSCMAQNTYEYSGITLTQCQEN
jgi:hypothetical protein